MTNARDTLTGMIAEVAGGHARPGEVRHIRDRDLLWIAEDSVIELSEVVGLSIGTDERSSSVLQVRLSGDRTITLDYQLDVQTRLPLFDAIAANIFAGEPLVTPATQPAPIVGVGLPLVQPPAPEPAAPEHVVPEEEQAADGSDWGNEEAISLINDALLQLNEEDDVPTPSPALDLEPEVEPEPDVPPSPQAIVFDEAPTVQLPTQQEENDTQALLQDLIGDTPTPSVPEPVSDDTDYAIPSPVDSTATAPEPAPVSEPEPEPVQDKRKEFDPDNESLEDWLSGLPTPNQEKLSVSRNLRLEKKPLLPFED
ncbi:hypothetical protein F8O06_05385 [Pseudoclavibacter sp. CFCC 14310]|uniref:hypothetical protein n=1 Tax=Pseudoclavibacter sp. CFCC 14310 TaxID=2615180 RepID=UPI001301339B|nr:hypothetical protein [Pseudoclavibacter sp. CFCC 14310]KAB1646199.1 hypothetical protein F8O06_05385 [Pseudoclavibacter sp. CFCC 14310]